MSSWLQYQDFKQVQWNLEQALVSDCGVGNYASDSVLNEYDAILDYHLYRSLVKNGGSFF